MATVAPQFNPDTPGTGLQDRAAEQSLVARLPLGRSWRVGAVVVMIALVSLADLYLTLTYLHNGGMSEGNPVARWVMSLGCPWLLGVWKVAMVMFTCVVLLAFRRRASTEIAAWVCCLAMGWLTFQWSGYVREVAAEVVENPSLTQASSWVAFDQD